MITHNSLLHLKGVVLGALAAMVLASVGCTTTTTGDGRSPQEPADPGRRAQARVELASNYFAREQNEVALEEVKLALDASPNFAAAYNLRGLIYGSSGETQLAEQNFRRALELDPRDGGILHNYGWFLCQQGRYDQAQAQYDAAVSLPTYRDPIRTLLAQGVCHARSQKYAQAEAVLMRANEMDVGNPVVGYNLADVLYRRGDYERARFFMRRINQTEGASNAQTLWLAARVENRLGNRTGAIAFGSQLRARFPQSNEAKDYERGRFDE